MFSTLIPFRRLARFNWEVGADKCDEGREENIYKTVDSKIYFKMLTSFLKDNLIKKPTLIIKIAL